ncbi:MAG: DUF4956 domain-containing protein [Pyrinomonadaceae bacterium]
MRGAKPIALVIIFGAIIIAAAAFFYTDRSPVTVAPSNSSANSSANSVRRTDNPLTPENEERTAPVVAVEHPVGVNWAENILGVLGKLLLAVMLSGVLAFRPRKDVPLFKRSLFVSQTQILLSVVAAALMIIVGDNTARAFAIFAAVSLVRFRTNIRDPKEITVLLISLALGLSAGVGRWDLGLALCLFSLALLWLLEYNESAQVFRSMELTIRTRDTDRAQEILRKILRKYDLEAEVRELDPPNEEGPIGSIVYYMNLRLNVSTDRLSERILRSDPDNIDAIQWSQKKGSSDFFQ